MVWLLTRCSSAASFTPENGFYNLYSTDAKNGEGTGLAVEIQNDYMFAAGYVYRENGTPTFVTIEGELILQADGTWGLDSKDGLYTYAGGQCIGNLVHCAYRHPMSRSVGEFSIRFSAANEGTLRWGSAADMASVKLRRACAGSICYDAPASLLGEWDAIVDHAAVSDGLPFGADKLAITTVAPSGDLRMISGCIAQSDRAPPNCASAQDRETIEGTATRCSADLCKAGYLYRLVVREGHCKSGCRIVRVYTFFENGHGGAFGGTIRGKVNLCPRGVALIDACSALNDIPFVAYRSGSVNFVRSGKGMN